MFAFSYVNFLTCHKFGVSCSHCVEKHKLRLINIKLVAFKLLADRNKKFKVKYCFIRSIGIFFQRKMIFPVRSISRNFRLSNICSINLSSLLYVDLVLYDSSDSTDKYCFSIISITIPSYYLKMICQMYLHI